MTRCQDCESEDRAGGQYCEACGRKIEPVAAEPEPQFAPMDEGSAPPLDMGGASWDQGAGDTEPGEAPTSGDDVPTVETGGEGLLVMAGGEEEPEPEVVAPSRMGYLIFPDGSEQPVPPSQWLLGRADLAKFLSEPDKSNEISRGHFTLFQEGDKYFVEDGKTMVQERPSSNKTWIVRGGSRILVTGTGRNELLDSDELDVAELVKLQFVVK